MKAYRVSIADYQYIKQQISKSKSRCILYAGYIFQDVGDEFCEAIVCASQKEVLSGLYEWLIVVTPFDIPLF